MRVVVRWVSLSLVAGLVAGGARAAEPSPEAPLEPSVTYGVVTSSELVREVIAKHIGEAGACFRKELARRPDLRSVSVLQWEVRRDGSISFPPVNPELAEMQERFEDQALRTCVLARIASWRFPAHGGEPIAVKVIIGFGQLRATRASPSGERPPAAKNEGGVAASSVDKNAIRAVVRAHGSEIQSCYEKRLASNPNLEGKVTIRWVIESDGSVTRAALVEESTTLRDPELHDCMMVRIATWRFPTPETARGGAASVTYPWFFRVEGAAAVQANP